MEGRLAIASIFAALAASGEAETARDEGGVNLRFVRVPAGSPGSWDAHPDGPETALVWSGRFEVAFRDHTVALGPGQACVVPAGAEHRGASAEGAEVMLMRQRPSPPPA